MAPGSLGTRQTDRRTQTLERGLPLFRKEFPSNSSERSCAGLEGERKLEHLLGEFESCVEMMMMIIIIMKRAAKLEKLAIIRD